MISHYTPPEGLAQGALFRKNAGELRWRLFWHLSSNACHCEPVTDVTGVAIRSSWLPLWGSCHEVTERVITSPLRLRHLSQRERQVTLIRLVLAGDARDSSPWSARGAFGCSRTSAFFDCSMPYVIRRTLEKVSYNSLKYFARGETTKFIRPILWEMTFFASEP